MNKHDLETPSTIKITLKGFEWSNFQLKTRKAIPILIGLKVTKSTFIILERRHLVTLAKTSAPFQSGAICSDNIYLPAHKYATFYVPSWCHSLTVKSNSKGEVCLPESPCLGRGPGNYLELLRPNIVQKLSHPFTL